VNIQLHCQCGARIRAKAEHAGTRAKCPSCGRDLVVPSAAQPTYDVFISYSSKDKPTADAACALLESRRIRCWIAPRDVLPGVEYGEAIVNAIAACRLMVLIFSTHANDSPQVRREVERALSKGKPILPFRTENVLPSRALEYCLSNTHWLDAFTSPLEEHLSRMAEAVQRLLGDSAALGHGPRPDSRLVAAALARPDVAAPPPVKAAGRHGRRLAVAVLLLALLVPLVGLWAAGVFKAKPKDGEKATAPGDTLKEERKPLAGTWQLLFWEIDGKKTPEQDLQKIQLVGDAEGKVEYQRDGEVFLAGSAQIDSTAQPAICDFTYTKDTKGSLAGKTVLGIYKIDGDTLTICYTPPGKDRPREFSGKAGSGLGLMIYRRQANLGDRVKEELKRLEGTWQPVLWEANGKKAPEHYMQMVLVSDSEGNVSVQQYGKVVSVGSSRIDPAARPAIRDVTWTKGDHAGKTILGIYKIDGNTLTLCYAFAGNDRPTEFTSKTGFGLTVYLRKTN
jgi:uncharacterized protein (TIGR03067 family)